MPFQLESFRPILYFNKSKNEMVLDESLGEFLQRKLASGYLFNLLSTQFRKDKPVADINAELITGTPT